jgi:hypothetical protein
MDWTTMQCVFAATYTDEIETAYRKGGEALLREKLASLSDGAMRVLRRAVALQPPA